MLIHLSLALLPALLALFLQDLKSNKSQRYLLYFICGMAMFLFMSLRTADMYSVDSLNYYRNYRNAIAATSWDTFFKEDHFEIGYQLCVYTLAQIFRDPQHVFVFSAAFFTISTIYFIEHNSEEPAISLVAYCSLGMMTFQMQGMRQAVAMSICLFAYEQAKRKHFWQFVILVLLAMQFHQTAIVFFVVYFLCRMQVTPKNLVFTGIIAATCILLSTQIISFANEFFGRDYTTAVESGGLVATAIYALLLLVCYLVYRNNREEIRSPLVMVLIVGAACYLMRYTGSQAAERISFYFVFAQVGLLPIALKLMVKEHRRYMYLLVVFLALALYAYRLDSMGFQNYRFFWEVPLM